MNERSGLDDTKYTLTEHLTELRGRLIKSIMAVVITGGLCLTFASEILEYSIRPLSGILEERMRTETLVVHGNPAHSQVLTEQLEALEGVRLAGSVQNLKDARAELLGAAEAKRPIDLLLVSSAISGPDPSVVADVLEGLTAPPIVAYLVDRDSIRSGENSILSLVLDGGQVLLEPVRTSALSSMVRRAAAAAGKRTESGKLVVLSPLEPFFAYLHIALVCGLFLACPIWLYQAWRFIAPGLYATEKRVVYPTIITASFLFIAGGAFAYYLMFPMMFDVLVNQFMPESVLGTFTVDNYLGLLGRVIVIFGVIFELPMVMAMLAAAGIVSAERLRRFRRYAIILAFIVGAILTPPDPISQSMMAVPLVLFFELGIILAGIFGKKERRGPAAESETKGLERSRAS